MVLLGDDGVPCDATPEVAAAMAADLAPWSSATSIDTSGPPVASLAAALALVQSP